MFAKPITGELNIRLRPFQFVFNIELIIFVNVRFSHESCSFIFKRFSFMKKKKKNHYDTDKILFRVLRIIFLNAFRVTV